jgi:hypothetical protein
MTALNVNMHLRPGDQVRRERLKRGIVLRFGDHPKEVLVFVETGDLPRVLDAINTIPEGEEEEG